MRTANEQTLSYATPPRRRSRLPWPWLVLTAWGIGLAYWSVADWWAYVGEGPTATPKFEVPLAWQLIQSSIVGIGATGLLYLAWRAAHQLARRGQRRGQ